jgi:hypothetical protein
MHPCSSTAFVRAAPPFATERDRARPAGGWVDAPSSSGSSPAWSPAHEKAGVPDHSFDTPACGAALRRKGYGPRGYQWSS